MTKRHLVHRIARRAGLDPLTCQRILEAFYEVIKESLTEGKPIYVRTFGSFIVKPKARRVARNISQNTAHVVKAHVIPYFKPSREFMDQVRSRTTPVES